MPCFATVFYKCSYNTGYCVVAEFIVQSEPGDCIKEALQILKTWNPNWHPTFFHDQLFWGRNWSFEGIFPGTTVYFCDCHREQAWERRVCDKKQSLSSEDAESLLDQLCPCAWTPVQRKHCRTTTSNKLRMPSKAQTCGKGINMCVRGLARLG